MTIAEVSKKYDITPDTLRYYERIGLLSNVPRSASGIRNYDEKACRRIEFVKCMRSAGVEIEILIEYMALLEKGKSTVEARKQLLEEQKQVYKCNNEVIKKVLEVYGKDIKEKYSEG